MNKKSKCPICHKHYAGYPALSRYDNKTDVCPDCGVVEAFNGVIIVGAREKRLPFSAYATLMMLHGPNHPLVKVVLKANKEVARLIKEGKWPPQAQK